MFLTSVAPSSTLTLKLTVCSDCPSISMFIPASNCSFVISDCCPSRRTLPFANSVPSGIVSCTTMFFPKSPSFLTFIVYVISSPGIT